MTDPALRNIAVTGKLTKRDGADVEVTTRFGRTLEKGTVRELLPYGFAARSKTGTVLVVFEGGDVRSPVVLPASDQDGVPDLEDGDAALWTADGGWIVARNTGSVELFGTSEGGVVKAKELKAQLDKTNAVVNTILSVLNATPPILEAGNGAPSVLQQTLKTALLGQGVGDFAYIESAKVLHGDGST